MGYSVNSGFIAAAAGLDVRVLRFAAVSRGSNPLMSMMPTATISPVPVPSLFWPCKGCGPIHAALVKDFHYGFKDMGLVVHERNHMTFEH
jgi:hypothetical protein